MTISSGPICTCLLAAAVLGALAYFKLDPERRVVCLAFFFVTMPIVLLIVYLTLHVIDRTGPYVSLGALILALLCLAGSLWQARVLLPKTEMR